jgi:hypothetical protein
MRIPAPINLFERLAGWKYGSVADRKLFYMDQCEYQQPENSGSVLKEILNTNHKQFLS